MAGAAALFLSVLTLVAGLWLARLPEPTLTARLSVSVCGLLAAQCMRLMKRTPSRTHGSAAFAEEAEIADLLELEGKPLTPGSVLLGNWKGRVVVVPPERARQHGLIIGGSGVGKSYSFFLPNAARSSQTSCVFTDPKAELYHFTSGFHTSLRYAPCEPHRSLGFNWIPLCKTARLAEIAARAIIEAGNTRHTEQIWLDMETAFLAALFSHASTLEIPTPLTAYRLFTRQKQETLLAQFAASASPVAQEQANIFRQAHEKMRGSIVPAVAARLKFMRDAQIARFTSATLTPPAFQQLRLSPASVYWCLHERDVPRLRPLTSLFFTLLLEELNGSTEEMDTSIPVLLYLDEAGTIPLPDFESTIALARGRGIGIWLGVQSVSQLEALYGRPGAATILANCQTKLAFPGLEVETAEYLSRTLGQGTVEKTLRSWQKKRFAFLSSSVNTSEQEFARPLLSADEVRRIPGEKILLITGNRRPMLLDRVEYTEQPRTATTRPLGAGRAMPISMEVQIATKNLPDLPDYLEDLLR